MATRSTFETDSAYLRRTVPYYATHSTPKSASYTARIANNIRAQKAARLPVNLEAARGHLVTPEHPNRKRPKLPPGTTVTKYRGGNLPKSKYLRHTVPLEKPIIHKRPVNPPERLNLSDGAVVDVYYDVGPLLVRLFELGDSWRVVLAGFDCTLGIWREIGVNRGHSRGITASNVIEQWEDAGGGRKISLEDWFIGVANSTDSDPEQTAERMTHICMWRVYAYPVGIGSGLRRQAG